MSSGTKHDGDKLRYDLFPPEALDEIAKVLTYGANKYDDRNWEKGIAYGRVFAATMRHLWSWWKREENDQETGISHLAHAGCNVLFLLAYRLRHMNKWDDRPHIRS